MSRESFATLFPLVCMRFEEARLRALGEGAALPVQIETKLSAQLLYICALLEQDVSYVLDASFQPAFVAHFRCPLPLSDETVFAFVCRVCDAPYGHRRNLGSPLMCAGCASSHCKKCKAKCTPDLIGLCHMCSDRTFTPELSK